MQIFIPLKDFESHELGSIYCKGLSYVAMPENAKLCALIPQWIKEGKIRPGQSQAKLTGEGKVK